MEKAIIGKKLGMTQLFDENGKFIPVTVVEAGPCTVVQKKTVENDGYDAVQVGYSDMKEKKANKPQTGHFGKANVGLKKFLREFRFDDCSAYEVGAEIKADVFADGDKIDVTGTSKGKGYQGVIKRHNFQRGPMAHGSGYHRGIGSMGSIQAARIKPGKKMPGRMGAVTRTVQNLEFVKYDAENNVILVKGNVPGAKNSYVMVTNAVKSHNASLNPESLA